MDLIIPTEKSNLTGQELDTIHQQHKEWLSEIAFWRDEAAFFYSLITKKDLKPITLVARSNYDKIEKELQTITINEFEKLQQAVEYHETVLNKLADSKDNDEPSFRKKHHQLALTLSRYEIRFKALKKEVFSLVEMITKEKNNLKIK